MVTSGGFPALETFRRGGLRPRSHFSFCGMLCPMVAVQPTFFRELYARFQSPISELDCGEKCAPYNQRGVPFCCDTRHAVPTAYQAEWRYLQENTDLWRRWNGGGGAELRRLQAETPPGQVLVACLGPDRCQRAYRALTCRAFPFFPYIDSRGAFLGLSYYWEYEDRCWVISNLHVVTPAYRAECIAAFETLFERLPQEVDNFAHHSAVMRKAFRGLRRAIPLLHRNGQTYKISPRTERLRRVPVERLPKFGPYKIAASLPFPDEVP